MKAKKKEGTKKKENEAREKNKNLIKYIVLLYMI